MPSNSLQFGVVAAAWSNDPRAAAIASRAAGFSGVQFDAISTALDLTDLSMSGRREFRQIIANQNQQIIGLRADVGPRGFGIGVDVDQLLNRLDHILETAAGLQSPMLCLDLGLLPAAPVQAKPRPEITPDMAGLILLPPSSPAVPQPQERPPAKVNSGFTGQVDSALSDLGSRADRYGVTVAMRSDLSGFGALERALAASGCPWFGIDLDPAALLHEQSPADEAFSRIGHLIRHVRGRDAILGADRRTRPATIGLGSVQWPEFLSLLDHAGYGGWLTIDPIELIDRPGAAVAGLAFLKTE